MLWYIKSIFFLFPPGVNNTGQDLQNSTDLHDNGSEEITRLQAEVDDLRKQLAEKDSAVEKLVWKFKIKLTQNIKTKVK